jgi:hypothetical protein
LRLQAKAGIKKLEQVKEKLKTIGCLNRGSSVIQPIKNKRT